MGERGEGWVVGQFILAGLVFLAPPTGLPGRASWLKVVGVVLIVVGLALGGLSVLQLGRNLTPFPRPVAGGQLVDRGVYRLVRHPIYLSVTLMAVGWACWRRSMPGLLLAIVLFLFFDAKARREEAWLVEEYEEYADYRQRVKKLIPWLY